MKFLKYIIMIFALTSAAHADLVYDPNTNTPMNGQIQYSNGVAFYTGGKIHREDHPSVFHRDGAKYWYINGLLHNVNGPAVIKSDGTKEWWVNGVRRKDLE